MAIAKTTPAEQAEPQKPSMKRVIVQKTDPTVKDTHQFVGFNNFEAQVQFDQPVHLPPEVVEYLRAAKRATFVADESGKPRAHYTQMFSIIDAPEAE